MSECCPQRSSSVSKSTDTSERFRLTSRTTSLFCGGGQRVPSLSEDIHTDTLCDHGQSKEVMRESVTCVMGAVCKELSAEKSARHEGTLNVSRIICSYLYLARSRHVTDEHVERLEHDPRHALSGPGSLRACLAGTFSVSVGTSLPGNGTARRRQR